MPASFDKAATVLAGSGSTAAITWAVSPTAGAKAVVAFSFPGAVTVTSVADNGTTPRTFTADRGPGAGSNKLYVYRADNITLPAAGSYTVTVTLSGASGGIAAGGATYLGVAAGGPSGVNAATGTSTAVSTGTATPAAAGALFFAAFNDASGLNPETITLTGTGFTGRGTQTNGASNVCTGFADKIDAAGPTATAGTWTLGDSVAWSAAIAVYDAATTGTPVQVTATQGGSTAHGMVLRLFVLTGARAAALQTGGGTGLGGAGVGQPSVTTTVAGSRVYGAALRASATAPTAAANTTNLDSVPDAGDGTWYGTWKATALTGTPGATVLGYTATFSGAHAGLEILPATTLAEDTSAPAAVSTLTLTAVQTASFTPPPGSLLVAMVSSNGAAAVVTIGMTDTLGLGWVEKFKGNASGFGYSGVWVADVPAAGGLLPQQLRRIARPPADRHRDAVFAR